MLFRMDLPNKKSIGVKAKPNRLIRDVFKPILNKYGYRMDTIDVHLVRNLSRTLRIYLLNCKMGNFLDEAYS